jgi:hypothetical protein
MPSRGIRLIRSWDTGATTTTRVVVAVRAGVALSIQPGRAVISGAALSACLAGIVTNVPLRFALWVHGDGTGGDLCAELRL